MSPKSILAIAFLVANVALLASTVQGISHNGFLVAKLDNEGTTVYRSESLPSRMRRTLLQDEPCDCRQFCCNSFCCPPAEPDVDPNEGGQTRRLLSNEPTDNGFSANNEAADRSQ
jgi:hypothetical protein